MDKTEETEEAYHQYSWLTHLPDALPTASPRKETQDVKLTTQVKRCETVSATYVTSTSKLQPVVPLIEYPLAWSSRPGKASPEIWSPSTAGNGSSSAVEYFKVIHNQAMLKQDITVQAIELSPSEEDDGSSRTGGR